MATALVIWVQERTDGSQLRQLQWMNWTDPYLKERKSKQSLFLEIIINKRM